MDASPTKARKEKRNSVRLTLDHYSLVAKLSHSLRCYSLYRDLFGKSGRPACGHLPIVWRGGLFGKYKVFRYSERILRTRVLFLTILVIWSSFSRTAGRRGSSRESKIVPMRWLLWRRSNVKVNGASWVEGTFEEDSLVVTRVTVILATQSHLFVLTLVLGVFLATSAFFSSLDLGSFKVRTQPLKHSKRNDELLVVRLLNFVYV
jgi:hypothetical protein